MPEHKQRGDMMKDKEVHFEKVIKEPPPVPLDPGKMEIKDQQAMDAGLEKVKWLRKSSGGSIDPAKPDMKEATGVGVVEPGKAKLADPIGGPVDPKVAKIEDPVAGLVEPGIARMADPIGGPVDPAKAVVTDPSGVGLLEPGMDKLPEPLQPTKVSNEPEEKPTLFERTMEKLEDTFEKVKKSTVGQNIKKDQVPEEEKKKAPSEALDSGLQKTTDAAEAIKNAAEPTLLEKAADKIGDTFDKVKKATVG